MKAKIEVTKIPGYESFTDEQKAALEGYEVDVPDPDYSGYVRKEVFDKKASEASELSKQLKSKMSDAELADAESAKLIGDMKTELEQLRREKTVSGYKAKLMGIGYDEALAAETANGLPDGVSDEFFANQQKFLNQQKKAIEAQALNLQPGLTAGDPPSGEQEDPSVAAFRRAVNGQ